MSQPNQPPSRKSRPARGLARPFTLAWLAYAYLWLLAGLFLGGLCALITGLVLSAFWLQALGLGTALLVLPCLLPLLRVRQASPPGFRLTPCKAPKLFETIEKIRHKIRGAKLDEIRLTEDFELRLVLLPRLGFFGWPRKVLLIGLPMLQLLSRKEIAALLARQFEHLNGYLDPRGARLHRLNQTWPALRQLIDASDSRLARLGLVPLRVLLSRFEAASRICVQAHEYQADKLGSRIIGPRIMADALIASHLARCFLDEQFWPRFWARAETNQTPLAPHSTMRAALSASATREQNERWLRTALEHRPVDDEPVLYERLRALGQIPEQPPLSTYSAAHILLGEAFPHILKDFDSHWLKIHARNWEAHRSNMREAREQVDVFSHCEPENLLARDQHRYGLALSLLGNASEALKMLGMAAENPDGSAEAALDAARHYLSSGNKAGVRYLELAVRRDPALDEIAGRLLDDFRARQMGCASPDVLLSAAKPQAPGASRGRFCARRTTQFLKAGSSSTTLATCKPGACAASAT